MAEPGSAQVPVATAFSRQPLGQRGGECLDPVRTPIRRKHFRAMLKCRRDMLADRQVVQGAGAGADREYGVVVAEVNLKLIQDLVSSTKVGERGVAYVVDVQDRVIAHPDLSLIRRKVSALPHVKAARAAGFGPLSAVDSQYSRAHPR